MELKVTDIGGSLGVVLPAELLDMLHASAGDVLTVKQTTAGIELSRSDEKLERQMKIAERVIKENRNLLHRLAQ